jgi:hypothetical protein
MEIELSDLSALPEALKAVVVTADGKSKLDLAKLMPVEDLTGLKTALQTERANNGAYSKYGKPDDIAKRISDLEAAAAKGGKGGEEAQAKLDAMKLDYDGKLSEKDQRLTAIMRRVANSDLKAELAKAGVIPEGLDILATFAQSRIAFNDDGSAKIMTADGKPMIGSGADHGATLGDLAKELAKTIPHLVKDGGAGGSGKQPGNGGTPEQKTVTRAVFDGMSQAERAAHSKSGGKVTD